MKRTIFMLMTFLIMCAGCCMRASAGSLLTSGGYEEDVPIDTPKKKVNPYGLIPMTCYVCTSKSEVGIRFKRDIGTISLLVTNQTTGESWNGLLDSSLGEGVLDISGTAGNYVVNIMLPDGTEYEGSFSL